MSEQQDVIDTLRAAGVIDALKWAAESACSRTMEDYSPGAGHDGRWVGNTRYILLEDRLDRVFGCRRYGPPPGGGQEADADLLHDQLPQHEVDSMPRLPVGLVVRSNLNGSSGWAYGDYRWLLNSSVPGRIDALSWKSETKKQVARQPAPKLEQGSLFEDLNGQSPEVAAELAQVRFLLDRPTLVLAHALNADTGRLELFLGQSKYNFGGGDAWHWREVLIQTPPRGNGRGVTPVPVAPTSLTPAVVAVPDAPVRLRRPAEAQPVGRAAEAK